MGFTVRFRLSVLILFFVFLMAFAQEIENKIIIHIINDLTKISDGLDVRCYADDGQFRPDKHLVKGEDCHWEVEDETQLLYNCVAIWEDKKSVWAAFDGTRDYSHKDVFWALRKEGVYLNYLAWDKSGWKRMFEWDCLSC